MPRKPMVTRHFLSTKCEVLCMDLLEKESTTISVEVGGWYEDESKLFRKVQRTVDTEVLKAVALVDYEKRESLRGMTETYFLEHSVELDEDTRKPVLDEQATEQ